MFGEFLNRFLSEEALSKKLHFKNYAELILESKKLGKPVITPERMKRKGMASDQEDPKMDKWLNS